MNKKIKILLTVILIGGFLISCSNYNQNISLSKKTNGNIEKKNIENTKNTQNKENKNEFLEKLVGTTWILESSSNNNIKILKNSPITLMFSKNEINGKATVNSYFASYKIIGNKITINKIAQTLIGSSKDLMDNEKLYLDTLENAKEIKLINENTLIIKNDKDELVFKN